MSGAGDVAELGVQRHLFEIPDGVAYLNCAYMAPNLRSVREAGERGVAAKSRPWEVSPDDFFADSQQARTLFASVLGGDADGVAIVPSVSYGIGVAAANLPVGRGERILVLAEQFPSNVYPWRARAEQVGAQVVTVARPRSASWTDRLLAEIERGAAVVAVPHTHWTDGTIVDLATVGAAAREAGAALVLDVTQSLGALPLDLSAVRPDAVVAAAYKWLLGPYSLGFLWVAEHLRQGQPLEHNWITREGSEDFSRLVDYTDRYAPGARRYDVGERSNFVLLPMAIAGLGQILDWGVDAVAASIAVRTAAIETRTRDLGLEPTPADHRGPHLMGISVPGGVPDGLTGRLAEAEVHVSVRGDSIRVAPHVWNTDEDVDRLIDVLAAVFS